MKALYKSGSTLRNIHECVYTEVNERELRMTSLFGSDIRKVI